MSYNIILDQNHTTKLENVFNNIKSREGIQVLEIIDNSENTNPNSESKKK